MEVFEDGKFLEKQNLKAIVMPQKFWLDFDFRRSSVAQFEIEQKCSIKGWKCNSHDYLRTPTLSALESLLPALEQDD